MIPFLINGAPVDCINQAAEVYHVPAKMILSIMMKEGGKNGQAVRNKNGTYDLGVMQVNEVWLPKIAPYGYTREDLQYNACKNISVGTWILSRSIAKGKSLWPAVGNYHSHTPDHNQRYRNDIYKNYAKISSIIF